MVSHKVCGTMKHALLLVAAAVCSAAVVRCELPKADADRIVAAIYQVEGGSKARVPYGILSVRVASREEARRVCYRTVQNNHTRWLKAGRPGSFLHYLANRYCPPSADPRGNRNWKANIGALVKGGAR